MEHCPHAFVDPGQRADNQNQQSFLGSSLQEWQWAAVYTEGGEGYFIVYILCMFAYWLTSLIFPLLFGEERGNVVVEDEGWRGARYRSSREPSHRRVKTH